MNIDLNDDTVVCGIAETLLPPTTDFAMAVAMPLQDLNRAIEAYLKSCGKDGKTYMGVTVGTLTKAIHDFCAVHQNERRQNWIDVGEIIETYIPRDVTYVALASEPWESLVGLVEANEAFDSTIMPSDQVVQAMRDYAAAHKDKARPARPEKDKLQEAPQIEQTAPQEKPMRVYLSMEDRGRTDGFVQFKVERLTYLVKHGFEEYQRRSVEAFANIMPVDQVNLNVPVEADATLADLVCTVLGEMVSGCELVVDDATKRAFHEKEKTEKKNKVDEQDQRNWAGRAVSPAKVDSDSFD